MHEHVLPSDMGYQVGAYDDPELDEHVLEEDVEVLVEYEFEDDDE